MKVDQNRVKNLLTDTVSLLCKNGLTFQDELKVQALIGITVDSEVFIVNVDKSYKNTDNRDDGTDVQASDEPPQNFTENRSPRRRQSQSGSRPGELVVDLTGSSRNGPINSPRSRGPVGGSHRMSTPPNTPSRRYGYSPRTPTNMGMQRSPMPSPGGRQRFMSPQQMQMMNRGYSPRQQAQRFPNSPATPVRRNLAGMMNNQRMPYPQSPRHGQPAPARIPTPTNRDEVIVLDEPANATTTAPQVATTASIPTTVGRVLGTIATTSTTAPITIQPDEPSVSSGETRSETSDKDHSSDSNIPVEVAKERTTPDAAPARSPTLTEPVTPLELTVTEEPTDDALSKLASELAENQHKRASEPEPEKSSEREENSAPKKPAKSTTVLAQASPVSSPAHTTPVHSNSPLPSPDIPPGTWTITPASPDTSGSDPKNPDAPVSPIIVSIVETNPDDSDQTSPPLSVQNIQGNFSRYEVLEKFRVPKKPPDEPSADEPPAKKPRSTNDSDSVRNAAVKKESQEKEESEESSNSQELLASDSEPSEVEEMQKKSLIVKLDSKNKNMASSNIRDMLSKQIVTPVLKKQEASVLAFRVSWRGDRSYVQNVWETIARKRMELDDEVVKPLGISFFLSTVTVENLPPVSFPAVGYWVVARHPDFDKDELIRRVRERSGGAEVRKLLKGEGGSMDEFGAICQLVKDVNDMDILEQLKESAGGCFPSSKAARPNMARFVLKENFFEHLLKMAVKNLRGVSFQAALDKVV